MSLTQNDSFKVYLFSSLLALTFLYLAFVCTTLSHKELEVHFKSTKYINERNLKVKPKRKVIMHIGPHKTGSTHIHSYLEKISEMLPKYQYCWPVKGSIQNSNMLAIHFISQRTVHNISVDWLNECLQKTENIILSAEAFDRFTIDDFTNFYNFFPPNQFEFQVVIIYREWLNHMYSLYTEIHKYTAQGTSFSEYLFKNIDGLDQIPILNMTRLVTAYSPIVGLENIHLLDYYGILAGGKDEAYVIVCEIMGILCKESEYLNQKQIKENEKPDMIASELFQIVRNQARLLGCHLHNDRRDPLTEFIKSYRDVNISVPISYTSLKLLHPVAERLDLLVRQEYGMQLHYGNRSANLAMIQKVNISEVNKLAFFNDPLCLEWLVNDLKLQIRTRKYVNCTKSITTHHEMMDAFHQRAQHRRKHFGENSAEATATVPTHNLVSSQGRTGSSGEKRNVSQKILELRKKVAQSLGVNLT